VIGSLEVYNNRAGEWFLKTKIPKGILPGL